MRGVESGVERGINQEVFAAAGGNAVTVDQVGTTAGENSSGTLYTGITVTAALTNPALVFVYVNTSTISITSPVAVWDFGGAAQTMSILQNQDAGSGRQVIIFGLRNPVSGNKTLRLTYSGGNNSGVGNAISFSHVNPASDAAAFPNFTGSSTGATPDSITITTGTNNYAIAGYSAGANFSSVSDSQLLINNTGANWTAASNYKITSGATDILTASPGSVSSTIAGGTIAHD